MVQILFLANPSCSSEPAFPYCSTIKIIKQNAKEYSLEEIQEDRQNCTFKGTWGKQAEIPPRVAFGDLKML